MVSSYQTAGWVGFAVLAFAGFLAWIIRAGSSQQITRLKLLLLLIILWISVPYYGFEALPGLGGTNVVAGRVVNWARYVVTAIHIALFTPFISLSLDMNWGKAFVAFWLGLGSTIWTIFASESSNQGVYYFWIFSAATSVLYSIFLLFFTSVPEERRVLVSYPKELFVKCNAILVVWVYVIVGYLIDTPWIDATDANLALLQWLNVGKNLHIYFFYFIDDDL